MSITSSIENNNPLILLADDDCNLHTTLKLILVTKGYRVVGAHDGAEAIDVFRQNRDQLAAVLLDYGMPVKDGGEVLQELLAQRPDLPVIVLSGYMPPDRERWLIAVGARMTLYKPFSMAEMLAAIESVTKAAAEETTERKTRG